MYEYVYYVNVACFQDLKLPYVNNFLCWLNNYTCKSADTHIPPTPRSVVLTSLWFTVGVGSCQDSMCGRAYRERVSGYLDVYFGL